MPFLTADWRHILLITYEVAPDRLAPYCPQGVEPEIARGGRAYCSLVAFDFLNTRVLGVKWPGHVNFPEFNLRFYVTSNGQRGVVFVRELVPQPITCAMARVLYNEPYSPARFRRRLDREAGLIKYSHDVILRGTTHHVSVEAEDAPFEPAPDSAEHFFKEQSWGFGQRRSGTPLAYRVDHPTWRVYPVRSWSSRVDWGALYGPAWVDMAGAEPENVTFAEGSAVTVSPWRGLPGKA
ncbi:MAG: DUF2071 domain-containing protein [Sumerlaeia bacterium]